MTTAARRAQQLYGNLPPAILKQDPIVSTDGSGESMRLTTVPMSQMSYVPQSSSSGIVSFEAVVISDQSTRTNLVQATGATITTATITVVPLSDVPAPTARYDGDGNQIPFPESVVINENRITIHTADMVHFDDNDPHTLLIVGSGKDPLYKAPAGNPPAAAGAGGSAPAAAAAAAPSGQRQAIPRVTYRNRHIAIGRGVPIVLETDKLSQLTGDKGLAVGDLIHFRGVTYDIERGKDGKEYEKIKCLGLQRLGNFSEVGARHNEIWAVLFGELPQRMPNLPVLIRRTDWNPEEARAKARAEAEKKKREESEAYGIAYIPASAEAGNDAQAYERQPDRKEQRKITEDSLTERSRKALNTTPFIIPVLMPSREHKDYRAAHGLPHKYWLLPGRAMTRTPSAFADYNLDVTDVQQAANAAPNPLRRDMSYLDPMPGPDGKQRRYVPKFNYEMQLFQSLPEAPMEGERVDPHTNAPVRPQAVVESGMQQVLISSANNAQQLTAYGIAEPFSLGFVGPVLYLKCPALNVCFVSDKEKTLQSVNQAQPASPMTYHLSGVIQVSDYATGKAPVPRPATSFLVDHAAGIISAGYPITSDAALKLIEIKAAQVGRTKVSVTMSDSKVQNAYVKLNPLGAVKRGDVQNLFETQIGYSIEKNDFQVFLVCNRAYKDFAIYPELEVLTNAFPSYGDACAFYGKLFLDMANGKFPAGMDAKEREAEPARAVEVDAVLTAYASELAKVANIKGKFPIDPRRLPSVFGPLGVLDASSDAHSKSPFVFVPFAIRKEYLQLRQMDKYLADYWYLDVLFPLATQRHVAAVEAITNGKAPSYSAWIKQVEAGAAAAATAPLVNPPPPVSPSAKAKAKAATAKPAAVKPPAKTPAPAPVEEGAAKRAKPAPKPAAAAAAAAGGDSPMPDADW